MSKEEIYKLVKILIGETSAYGSHSIDMDKIVPNVDKFGQLVMALYSDLHDVAITWEDRPESSIKAVGQKARYWLDFIDKEILERD